MSSLEAVYGFLGGKDFVATAPRTELDLLPAVRQGFPWLTVENLYEKTGLPDQVILDGLGISERTLARRKAAKYLQPVESESVLRFAQAFVTATQVLGSVDKASTWLRRANRALRGEPPVSLLRHDIGFRQVMNVLGRIDCGVYS